MSAYMVDRNHVQYLVQSAFDISVHNRANRIADTFRYCHDDDGIATHRALRTGDWDEATRIGQMLWDENRRSIEARYADTRGGDEVFRQNAPGPVGETYHFEYTPTNYAFDPLQVICSCQCYEYQACEHREWETSEAHTFIRALIEYAIGAIDGINDRKWGAPQPHGSILSA